MPDLLAQCDCCDYYTIPEGQDFEICPVCFWEQDTLGTESPDDESGANNGLTLREGRRNFAQFGACEERLISEVVPVAKRAAYRHVARTL